jgi:hypothetical protein
MVGKCTRGCACWLGRASFGVWERYLLSLETGRAQRTAPRAPCAIKTARRDNEILEATTSV